MTIINNNAVAKLQKLNSKLENGFEVDMMKYLMNTTLLNKKVFINKRPYASDHVAYLQVTAWFEKKSWNNDLSIFINIAHYTRPNGWSNYERHGLGYTIEFTKGIARRNFNEMVLVSKQLTDDTIIKLFNEQSALHNHAAV